jgi:Flp pilus assembly protein CpaB
MQPSRLPLTLALITFALALLAGAYGYSRLIRTVPVLVAVRDIPAGAQLGDDLVRVERIPAGGAEPQSELSTE